jgi:hypothetical protein
MSKPRNEDQPVENQADNLNTAEGESPADAVVPGGEETPPELLAIEEHARNLNIDKPVFAAVMQSEKWAGGKKVSEADFKKAVEGFLNAPMGGTA